MASVTRDQDQKPPASALSSPGRGAGAGFDIFTSTSCFLFSSRPPLGSGCSVSRCFIPVFPLRGTCRRGRRRAGTSSRSDGGAEGAGPGWGPAGKKILGRVLQRIDPQLLESRESASRPAHVATARKMQVGRVGMAGRGRQCPSLEWGQPTLGSRKVGGLSVLPDYQQLHPLPSPPLSPPGFSQLIPLAASLRHLQGLKTATVAALTPGDPRTPSPAPSGHCPPRPRVCPPVPGG